MIEYLPLLLILITYGLGFWVGYQIGKAEK